MNRGFFNPLMRSLMIIQIPDTLPQKTQLSQNGWNIPGIPAMAKCLRFISILKNVIFTMLLLKKENEIYKRHLNLQKKKLIFKKSDKFTFVMLNTLSRRAIGHLTMAKPETLLSWQRRFIKNFWSYKHKTPGRKSVTRDIKNLILENALEFTLCNGFYGHRYTVR